MPEPTTPEGWAVAIKTALEETGFPPGNRDFLKSVMAQASRGSISTRQLFYVRKRITDRLPNFLRDFKLVGHARVPPIMDLNTTGRRAPVGRRGNPRPLERVPLEAEIDDLF